MKRFLITGATGFVGACLTRKLVEQGHKVDVVTRATSDMWRLDSIIDHIKIHHADLRDAAAIQQVVKQVRPAVVCHLAAYGTFASQTDKRMIAESNYDGTANLLSACLSTGFERFINTGSSSEYGEKTTPMKETDIPEPADAYAIAKAGATEHCRLEAENAAAPVVTLRIFSPYGPWDDPRRLIPYVIKSLLRGERPRLSTPQSVRDYIYIDDIIEAYLGVLKADLEPGEILNIGSGIEHSIGDVVDRIVEAVGNDIEPEWGAVDPRRHEPEHWCADITRAADELGWTPATPLSAGIGKTVGWFQENLDFYPLEERLR
jgi:nucleoside-diphosphate-sugar epimerase